MRTTSLFVVGFAGLAVAHASASLTITTGDTLLGDRSANLIGNGSFETGNPGFNVGWTPSSFHLGGYPGTEVATIPGWSSSWPDGAYGWWGPLGFGGAPNPHGSHALYFGNSFNSVGTSASIASNGVITFGGAPSFASRPGPVSISQTVSGLSTSVTHRLEFWVSGESNTGGFTGTGLFGLEITGEGITYLLLPASSNAFGASERYYVDFVPSASTIDIKFHNWGHITDISGTGTELILDDVILNVPAPASLALLGFGALAAGRRRR